MKVYVCDTWDSLSDIGESISDNRAYVTREAAERRAERIRRGGHDGTGEHARVVELELCAEPSNTDRLIAERTAWYLHAKNVEVVNAKLRELVAHIHTCLHLTELFNHDSCIYCPMHGDEHNCEFESRMKALGIELDI